jgi:hypothetical protein
MGALQRSEGEVSSSAAPSFGTRFCCLLAISWYTALIYNATNAIAHARGTTHCIAMPWEHHLPLVTWLVVPYLLVDVLMGISALFATNHTQLRTLMRRIFWAFGVGNLIFLLLPLRCEFPRTVPADWTAPLFRFVHFVDLPYNQAPSAHIYEAMIMTPVYWTRFPHPLARAAFLLIVVLGSAGTVLTYQHHVLDVVSGGLFGLLFMRLIPAHRNQA